MLRCGGARPDDPALADGFYYLPTILDRCTSAMSVTQDESFGPVLTVETFRDEDEAVAIANDSIYGLAGAVWTQDAGKGQRVAGRLRMGTVWINDYHPYVPQAEWGGYKQSGIGRELGQRRARRVPRDQARLAQHPARRAALVRGIGGRTWVRTGTTSSSWVVARPDARSRTGSPPTPAPRCWCWRPAAPTTGSTRSSTCRRRCRSRSATGSTTGSTRPTPSRT